MDGRDLHVGDLDWGVLPPAAPLTIATQTLAGMAYAWKLRGEPRVCISFIGDGGSSLGEWHETVNLAAVQKLPLVFVVENNQWALGTHVSEQTATRRFALRAAGYGMPGRDALRQRSRRGRRRVALGRRARARRPRAGVARAGDLSPHRPRPPRRRPLLRQPRGEDRRLRARGRAAALGGGRPAGALRGAAGGDGRRLARALGVAARRGAGRGRGRRRAPRRRRRGRRAEDYRDRVYAPRVDPVPAPPDARRARARWPTTRRCARRSPRR